MHARKSGFLFIIVSFVILFSTLTVGLCYYSLIQLVFKGDRIIFGQAQSTLARDIREELLSRSNASAEVFQTAGGFNLSGILIKRDHATSNVVICHGYKGGKEFMYSFIDLFPTSNMLLFDFRAHGESEGSITSIGCHEYKDVIAAVKFLKTRVQKADATLPTILVGVSMGGASTIKAVQEDSTLCDAVIVDSAYAFLEKALVKAFSLKSRLPSFPFFTIIKKMLHYRADCDIGNMNPSVSVKQIKQPILFIHSCDDEFVSPKHVLELYANAQHPRSKLWIGPRCRHGWLHVYYQKMYQRKVARFLEKSIGLDQSAFQSSELTKARKSVISDRF